MARNFPNWIDSYLRYNYKTESAVVFHKWAALSAIAAALRRKVYFRFGRIKIFPNMYIVLVAEPGTARKTEAIRFSDEFVSNTQGIHIAPDATSPRALLQSIEDAADDSTQKDGSILRHCSLTIMSDEFSSFLGNKKENSRMIDILTDLYDGRSKPFKYNTQHSGSNTLPLPFLNVIAATTPGSIAECFPSVAIGGGLSSRMMFICAEEKAMKVPIPEFEEGRAEMYTPLLQDMGSIARISGEYNYSKDGREWWLNFYDKFEERDPRRLCKDPSFISWYSRKPAHLIKVATNLAAAQSSKMEVTAADFELALKYIEEVEPLMGNAFTGVGRSDITTDVDMVRKIIQRHGNISERQLRQLVWRDIDDRKFEAVMNTITKAGRDVRPDFKGPKGQKGVWYYWNTK